MLKSASVIDKETDETTYDEVELQLGQQNDRVVKNELDKSQPKARNELKQAIDKEVRSRSPE